MEPVSNRGLVDTLAAGYGTLNRRLFLLLLPIGLDVLLWLGPKVSVASLINTLLPLGAANNAPGPAVPVDVNILGLLAFQIPSLIGFSVVQTAPASPVLETLGAWSQAALWGIGLGAVGLLVASFFLGVLAAQVRGESPGPSILVGRTALYWTQFVALLLLVMLGAAVIAPGLALVFAALSGGSAEVMAFMVSIAVVTAAFCLFFVEDALFVSRVSSVNALRYGLRVIRRSFRPAITLFLVAQVVALGMGIIWRNLSGTPMGLMAAIIGNAYIGTGLLAAGMVFYQDRIRLIELEQEEQTG